MTLRYPILAALVLFILLLHPAVAAACDAVSPTIDVDILRRPVSYDYSLDMRRLTSMAGNRHKGATLGITAVDYLTHVRVTVRMTKSIFGSWCAYPTEVHVRHGFSDNVRVYLARDLVRGSCRYRTTLAHEMQHVAIHERGLSRAKSVIRDAILQVVDSAMPVKGSTREEAAKRAETLITDAATRAAKAVIARTERENAAIDTDQSYRAMAAACSHR